MAQKKLGYLPITTIGEVVDAIRSGVEAKQIDVHPGALERILDVAAGILEGEQELTELQKKVLDEIITIGSLRDLAIPGIGANVPGTAYGNVKSRRDNLYQDRRRRDGDDLKLVAKEVGGLPAITNRDALDYYNSIDVSRSRYFKEADLLLECYLNRIGLVGNGKLGNQPLALESSKTKYLNKP